MTAATRKDIKPLDLTEACRAELRAIKPVTLAEALEEYAADVRAMSDEQLNREAARVEALPGCGFRRIANEEADGRHERAELVAAMAPPRRWGWTR